MKISIRIILVIIISIMYSLACKGGVPVLTRSDDGSERCFLYFTSFAEGGSQQQFAINMIIHIRNISENPPVCSFPWVIKAFVGNKEVGSSDEISFDGFQQAKDLLRNNSTVIIPVRSIREFQQDCYTNPCNDFYTTVHLSFKLYSGEDQIDMTCPLFDSDEFVPNSHVDVKDVRFLGCQRDDENDDDGGDWTPGPRGSNQYLDIIDQGSTAYSSPKFFDTHSELQLDLHTQTLKNPFASGFKIFPNPSDQYLNIELPLIDNRNLVIEFFDNTGRLVKLVDNVLKSKYQLDLSNIKPGAYLLRFKVGDLCVVKKVMVVH